MLQSILEINNLMNEWENIIKGLISNLLVGVLKENTYMCGAPFVTHMVPVILPETFWL